ncbi:hypothetical protein Gotur_034295 [Gossypium turneri]
MEKGFLDKVEDNAAVRTWSETTQHEKGDSLAEGYVSELWDFTRISKVDKVSYRVFSENYLPLKEIVATPMKDNIPEKKWMTLLQILQEEDVEWRALWLLLDEILYWCGDFDWVPLLGIWGAVGYAPLLVLRQYRSR